MPNMTWATSKVEPEPTVQISIKKKVDPEITPEESSSSLDRIIHLENENRMLRDILVYKHDVRCSSLINDLFSIVIIFFLRRVSKWTQAGQPAV